MKSRWFVVGVAVLTLTATLVFWRASPSQTTPPTGKEASGPAVPAKEHRVLQYIQLLTEEVDVSALHQPQKLGVTLEYLSQSVAKGRTLPIYLDKEDFKHEAPDAPDPADTDVTFPATVKKMSRAAALRFALAKMPTDNATFVVTREGVRILTLKSASLPMLARQKVIGVFKNQPLEEVLRQLSQTAGVTVIVDQARAGDKAKTPVSATFTNDVSIKGACEILADLAGLKCLARDEVLYVTTTEQAQALQKEQKEQMERRMKLLMPGANPNNPMPGGFNPGGGLPGGFNPGGGLPGGFNNGGFNGGGFVGGISGFDPEPQIDPWHWHSRTDGGNGPPGIPGA